MSLSRSLVARLIATSAFASLISVALTLFWFATKPYWGSQKLLLNAFDVPSAVDWQQCRSDPSRFAVVNPHYRIDAYDSTTHQSANPNSPVLTWREDFRLDVGAEPHLTYFEGPYAMLMTRRAPPPLDPDGPCGLMILRFTMSSVRTHRAEGTGLLLWIALLMTLSIGLLTYRGALFPLLQRIQHFGAAALQVGTPDYNELHDSYDPAFASLAVVLNAAHARILDDAHLREQRREALERHLADIAHDLRTPLQSLQLSLESVRDDAPPSSRSRLDEALSDIVYLTELTANLNLGTQLSLDTGPFPPSMRVDLTAVATRVGARFEAIGRLHGVEVLTVRPDDPVWAQANPIMVEQAVANLLHNAVHHNCSGGHVALVLEREGADFVLTVVDDGPGVPPEELPRLTERLFQGQAATARLARGTGLGLAIAGSVCERAGWSIRFEAADPCGLQAVIRGSGSAS